MTPPYFYTRWCMVAVLVTMMVENSYSQPPAQSKDRAVYIGETNGGYKGLVVALSDDSKGGGDHVLERIRIAFDEASKALFLASGEQFYLDEITILLPETWGPEKWNNATIEPTPFLSFEEAHVRIDQSGHFTAPYVKRQGGRCGQPGQYVHLTPDFIEKDDDRGVGKVGKVLAHELGHLLWGVFEEYPRLGIDPQYYTSSSGIRPNTCSKYIIGSFRLRSNSTQECTPNTAEDECVFVPKEGDTSMASLMGYTHLKQVSTFCDANTHNDEALTEQNAKCDGRSVMGVVEELLPEQWARRYNNVSHAPRRPCGANQVGDYSTPCFNIRKVGTQRHFAFLLAYVRTKILGNRLRVVTNAVRDVLSNALQDSSSSLHVQLLGGDDLMENYTVRNTANISTVIDAIPEQSDDKTDDMSREEEPQDPSSDEGPELPPGRRSSDKQTDRGCINPKILLVLQTMMNVSDGAEVFVFIDTGGNEQEHKGDKGNPNHNETTDPPDSCTHIDLSKKGLRVNCIVFRDGQKLADALKCSTTSRTTRSQGKVKVIKNDKKMTMRRDKTNGKYLSQKFFYEKGQRQELKITLSEVSNHSINLTVTLKQRDSSETATATVPPENLGDGHNEYTFPIPDNFKPDAMWYNVSLPGEMVAEMEVAIEGTPVDGVEPILARAVIQTPPTMNFSDPVVPTLVIGAEVTQGYLPVLNASVSATVTFQDSNGTDIPDIRVPPVMLKDDGLGADDQKDDGLYSAFFVSFPINPEIAGVSVSIKVDNSDRSAYVNKVNKSGSQQPSGGAFDSLTFFKIPDPPTPELTDPFERIVPETNYEIVDPPTNGSDLYAPARVVDLRVYQLEDEKRWAYVRFTATGDDLVQGNASHFLIHHAPSIDALRNSFPTSEMVPSHQYIQSIGPPGERMDVKVDFNHTHQSSFALAVVIVDDVDKKSEPSNLAYFVFSTTVVGSPSTSPSTTTSTTTMMPTKRFGENEALDEAFDQANSTVVLILSICVPILAIALIVAAVLVLLYCCRRRRKKTKQPPSVEQVTENPYDFIPGSSYRGSSTPGAPVKKNVQQSELQDRNGSAPRQLDGAQHIASSPAWEENKCLTAEMMQPDQKWSQESFDSTLQSGEYTREFPTPAAEVPPPLPLKMNTYGEPPPKTGVYNRGNGSKAQAFQSQPPKSQAHYPPLPHTQAYQGQGYPTQTNQAQAQVYQAQAHQYQHNPSQPFSYGNPAYSSPSENGNGNANPYPGAEANPILPPRQNLAGTGNLRNQPNSPHSHLQPQARDAYPLARNPAPNQGGHNQGGLKARKPPPVASKPRLNTVPENAAAMTPPGQPPPQNAGQQLQARGIGDVVEGAQSYRPAGRGPSSTPSTTNRPNLHHSSMEDIANRNTLCEEFTDVHFEAALEGNDPYAMQNPNMQKNSETAKTEKKPMYRDSGIYHDNFSGTPMDVEEDVAISIQPEGPNWQFRTSPAQSPTGNHPTPPPSYPVIRAANNNGQTEKNPFDRSSFYDQIDADAPSSPLSYGGWREPVAPTMFSKAGFSMAPSGQLKK